MSQQLQLDFIKRSPFALRYISSIGLVFCICGLVLAAMVGLYYQAQLSALQQAQAALAQAQPKASIAEPQAALSAVSAEETQQARAVADELTMPWPRLLSNLEAINQPNIALLSMTPNKKKQQVQLTGQAKNMQTALLYIQQLEASPMLSHVYLQKHEVDVNDTYQPVNFTIVASW